MTEATQATPETSNDGGAASATTSAPVVAEQTAAPAQAQATQTEAASVVVEGEKTATEAEAKPIGAPETYEFKAPEGQTLDTKVMEQFGDIARELNLPQEAAQKFVDKLAPLMQARQQEAMDTARNEWAQATKNDSELGGNKLDANLATAKKALDQFGTPELKTLLNDTGLGNHPEVIRMFARAGKTISEDTFVAGRQSSTAASTQPASVLYPTQS